MTGTAHKYSRIAHRSWQGLICPEPPASINDLEDIQAQAAAMLAQRQKAFPVMVHNGKISATEAQRQLAIWQMIADEWHWIVTGEGEPAPPHTVIERREALDESLKTLDQIHQERGGFDEAMNDMAHLVIAMRWHIDADRRVDNQPDIILHCQLHRQQYPAARITSFRYITSTQKEAAA